MGSGGSWVLGLGQRMLGLCCVEFTEGLSLMAQDLLADLGFTKG